MSESNSGPKDPGVQIEELNKKMIEAADSGDHEGVSRALEEGAEITYRDGNGDTGLHIEAVEGGDHEGVSRALGEGAEITCRDRGGDTGLHIGARRGHDSMVKTFLENGIDV